MKQQGKAVSVSGLLSTNSRDSIAPEIETFTNKIFVRSSVMCVTFARCRRDDSYCSNPFPQVDASPR